MGFSFWIREFVGWILVLVGLYGYWITLAFLAAQPARLIEGTTTAFVSTILFKGGLSLVRVATAARILVQSRSTTIAKK
jgi:predicted Na+-dependent transporter